MFLSRDPVIGVMGGSAVRFNPYIYAGANPVNYVDPNGQFFFLPLIPAGVLAALKAGAILFAAGAAFDVGAQLVFDGRVHDWGSVAISGTLSVIGGGVGHAAKGLSWIRRFSLGAGADLVGFVAADVAFRDAEFGDAFRRNFLSSIGGEIVGDFIGRSFKILGQPTNATFADSTNAWDGRLRSPNNIPYNVSEDGMTLTFFDRNITDRQIGQAWLERGESWSRSELRFDISTIDYDTGISLTEVRGTEIFRDAFDLLGGKNNIQQIRGLWIRGQSVNYDDFVTALQLYTPERAALEFTWTGRRALELGYRFPYVDLTNQDRFVEVIFTDIEVP
jgi:hypothetical protein